MLSLNKNIFTFIGMNTDLYLCDYTYLHFWISCFDNYFVLCDVSGKGGDFNTRSTISLIGISKNKVRNTDIKNDHAIDSTQSKI